MSDQPEIREYSEEMPVAIERLEPQETYSSANCEWSRRAHDERREVVIAHNEGGFNCTQVDLGDLIEWCRRNRPELFNPPLQQPPVSPSESAPTIQD